MKAETKLSVTNWETLSLQEQVAQMIVVRASGYLFDHEIKYPQWEPPNSKLKYWIKDLGVGGVILLGGSAIEIATRSQQLQSWAKIPLLVSADIEEGVGQRFSGATWFPPPMALAAIARQDPVKAQYYAEQMGAVTAKEALAIGINWVLAPVVDVNNNPLNPVINIRAFGEIPLEVSQLTTAFIKGCHQYPVLTTAKHFPGHGDTATDSHLHLPVLPHSAGRLARVELPPFQAAIKAGVDTVMSAHLLIPAWDAERPATLSEPILTQLLRQDMRFEGLIVTDALVMGAIANQYGANEAPILALEAGADILLMPVDPTGAIAAICNAVTSGRIPIERIHASLERIWKAKSQVCTPTNDDSEQEAVSLEPIYQLAQPEALEVSAQILQDAQQVYGCVPLTLPSTDINQNFCNLIVVDDALNSKFLGQYTPAVTIPRQRGYQVQLIDSYTPVQPTMAESSEFSATLLQLFIRGNPFRGSANVTPIVNSLFNTLLSKGELQALVIYGSPYILQQLLPKLPSELPCIFSFGQTPQAQAIALNALFDSPKVSS